MTMRRVLADVDQEAGIRVVVERHVGERQRVMVGGEDVAAAAVAVVVVVVRGTGRRTSRGNWPMNEAGESVA